MPDTPSAPTFAPPADTPAAQPGAPPTAAVDLVVLDSNAVLDWLLFNDAAMQPLGTAVAAGHCRWIVTAALRGELEHVLARGLRSRPALDAAPLWQAWQRLACAVEPPPDVPPPPGLRCSDGDDQKFLDLALAQRARWLVSRDRALLKLRRRARERGLLIVTPAQWVQATAPLP